MEPFVFFLRIRWTPVRGSTFSLTVQYEPLPRSVRGRGTFSKHGFRDKLWRTEFCGREIRAVFGWVLFCNNGETNRASQITTSRTRRETCKYKIDENKAYLPTIRGCPEVWKLWKQSIKLLSSIMQESACTHS